MAPIPRIIAFVGLAVLVGTGCKSTSNDRVIKTSKIEKGPGSLEYERRQLMGKWTIDRFEVADAAGQFHPVKAQGWLTYDEFGNMVMSATLLEPMPGTSANDLQPILDFKGQITIDPDKKEFHLSAPGAASRVDAGLQKVAGEDIVRKYEITDNVLTVTYVTREGRTTGRAVLKRG